MGTARGSRTPHFGALLRTYRRKALGKRSSLEQVTARLAEVGFPSTDKSTIFKYENGRPPDVGLLYGLSVVYGLDFTSLCLSLAAELIGRSEVPPAMEPVSEEARAIAKAFDAGPEALRQLLRQAVMLGAPGRSQPTTERAHDMPAAAGGNRGRARKARATR